MLTKISIEMKKTSSPKAGKKGKQYNSLKLKAPDLHDDPLRHQPPSPQAIQRVQPKSQANQRNNRVRGNVPQNRKGSS